MKKLAGFLAHLAISMNLGMLVLLVLDSRNPQLGILTSGTATVYIVLMCVLSVSIIIAFLSELRKKP